MNAINSGRPPVDIEQWLDFIIAAQSHRSRNEGQRKFGELLINRYFVALYDGHKNNAVAKAYLDHMLCVVASAITRILYLSRYFWNKLGHPSGGKKARGSSR
jgi:hypothetical protein